MDKALDYFVIVGFSRSGTTSLFNYLSDHPEVSVSKRKELNFFNNTINRNNFGIVDINLEWSYAKCFSTEGGVKIDATPEYICSLDSIRLLHDTLRNKNYKIAILVRDRFARLESWFDYARMKGIMKSRDSLYRLLINDDLNISEAAREIYKRENALNYYYDIIRKTLDIIPEENVIIIRTSDLRDEPLKTMMSLSCILGISKKYYQSYDFRVYNRSSKKSRVAFVYWIKLRKFIRSVYRPKYLQLLFKWLKRLNSPKLIDLNSHSIERGLISEEYNDMFRKDQALLDSEFGHLIIGYED
jgi:hypothetical protein